MPKSATFLLLRSQDGCDRVPLGYKRSLQLPIVAVFRASMVSHVRS